MHLMWCCVTQQGNHIDLAGFISAGLMMIYKVPQILIIIITDNAFLINAQCIWIYSG